MREVSNMHTAPPSHTAPSSRRPLLERKEVAKMLRLSVASLEKWAETGSGPRFYRRGLSKHSRACYRVEDIEQFVSERYGPEVLATLASN